MMTGWLPEVQVGWMRGCRQAYRPRLTHALGARSVVATSEGAKHADCPGLWVRVEPKAMAWDSGGGETATGVLSPGD
eukprot:2142823-Prymnesium_polylepis.1